MSKSTDALRTGAIPLYLGEAPDSPDACLVLFEYPGEPPVMGYTARLLDLPYVQVMARGAAHEYRETRLAVQRAYDALSRIANTSINGTSYLQLVAIQSGPELVGYDEKRRPTLTFNVKVMKALSSVY